MKREFLAIYDYQTGGIWMIFLARSTAEIEAKYRALHAYEQPPDFIDMQTLKSIRETHFYDIDDPPDAWLANFLEPR